MDDIDRMLRSSLREHAELTPAPVNLLGAVHDRSRQLTRRRRFALSAAAATVLAFSGTVAALPIWWGGPAVPPAGPPQVVPSARPLPGPSRAPTTPSVQPPGSPSASPSPGRPKNEASGTSSQNWALRMAAPQFAVPAFPWVPGVTPIGGLDHPEITVDQGQIVAYYPARDPVRGADVTIRVSPQRPTFSAHPAGPVTESSQHTRGRPATLRTVHVAPAAQLSLYWREASGRWVRVDTDDTLTDAQVVRFADELKPASLPVPRPFALKLAPVGMLPYTVSRSAMAFRPADGPTDVVTCVLTEGNQRRKGQVIRVGQHSASLIRTGTAAVLAVAMDDRGETLTVTVPARYPVTDTDLIRFAAGISITDYAEP